MRKIPHMVGVLGASWWLQSHCLVPCVLISTEEGSSSEEEKRWCWEGWKNVIDNENINARSTLWNCSNICSKWHSVTLHWIWKLEYLALTEYGCKLWILINLNTRRLMQLFSLIALLLYVLTLSLGCIVNDVDLYIIMG